MMINDFITGKEIPEIGPEANRQAVEQLLVNEKGYARQDVEVDAAIKMTVGTIPYLSRIDLVVCVRGTRFMAIKCAAASLGSWAREIIAAARLIDKYQIPLAVVSDGRNAMVFDTVSGKKIGDGLDSIPSKSEAEKMLKNMPLQPFPPERLDREKLIFSSYDSMNVNRNIAPKP
jgi:hypothetical protein